MKKITFEIQENNDFKIENGEILFTTRTVKDLNLKDRFITFKFSEVVPIHLRVKCFEDADGKLEDNIGYVNLHVYMKVSGNKIGSLETITLGADPEFFLVNADTNHAITFGVIQQIKRQFNEYQRDIGMDGAGFIGEFRPVPSRTPKELSNNIKDLLVRTDRLISQAVRLNKLQQPVDKWRLCGHSFFQEKPAGFHIHIGLPKPILSNKEYLYSLVRSLDYFLGIPCLLIDKQFERRIKIPGRRFTGNYGKAFSCKYSNITLEYRMPGGFHLRSPHLSDGILSIAALISEDFIARAKALKKSKVDEIRLYSTPQYGELQEAFNKIEHPNTMPWFEDIRNKTERMISFNKYKEPISLFFGIIDKNTEITEDILSNWQVRRSV
jgi:hypothetical protein